ncbi:MAG: ATP-dependent helicase [Pseudomonadota bacterium]
MTLTVQQAAAIAEQGNLMLTACPGSGKTRTLIEKLVREIEGVRGTPQRICCITYTNTAVQEIEHRTRQQTGPDDGRYIDVSTIHSFCLNAIVRPYAWLRPELAVGRRILNPDNPDFAGICDFAAQQVNLLHLTPSDYEAFENLSLDSNGQIVGLAAENVAVTQAAPHFWARCQAMGYITFSSIIYGAFQLLRDHPAIATTLCARYPWFLIDEFQDTTELQIEILRRLYATGRSRFFCVGDLAQSIFGFTGARPELVAPFAQHIGARTNLTLSGNFRSSQRVVNHAERLFPRNPTMTAEGENRNYPVEPFLVRGVSTFQAITEYFLPALEAAQIPLGKATILAKDWMSLIRLARQLRDFQTPIVGPGARPYRRSRLFATLAEQLCGAVTDPDPDTTGQLERALYHAIQEVTGAAPTGVFSFEGRRVIIRLLREAAQLANANAGAVAWLDAMSTATGRILADAEFISPIQGGLFFASVQEMKVDMARQEIDAANLSIADLGLFASPTRALRLSTIHYAKGREYDAVALIGLRRGTFPHFRADTAVKIEAEKRQFYVGVTRAKKLLMYVSEQDNWNNPPSIFLGPQGVNVVPVQ